MRNQQDAIYAAERRANIDHVVVDLAETRSLYDRWSCMNWWERSYPNVARVEVSRGDGGKGVAGVGWFDASKCAGMCQFAADVNPLRRVVHELAHVLASARYDSRAHCPFFARTYLELLWHTMGPDAYVAVRLAFDDLGVIHDHGLPVSGKVIAL